MSGLQVFAIFISIGGIYAIGHPFLMKKKIKESESWPEAEATILKSKLRKKNQGKVKYASIKFKFSIQGKEYISKKILIGGEVNTSSSKRAIERVEKYSVGSTHIVFYNPKNPKEAYLERGQEGVWFSVIMGLTFTIIGVGILTGLFSS